MSSKDLCKNLEQIRNYKGATDKIPISVILRNKKIDHITSTEMIFACFYSMRNQESKENKLVLTNIDQEQ